MHCLLRLVLVVWLAAGAALPFSYASRQDSLLNTATTTTTTTTAMDFDDNPWKDELVVPVDVDLPQKPAASKLVLSLDGTIHCLVGKHTPSSSEGIASATFRTLPKDTWTTVTNPSSRLLFVRVQKPLRWWHRWTRHRDKIVYRFPNRKQQSKVQSMVRGSVGLGGGPVVRDPDRFLRRIQQVRTPSRRWLQASWRRNVTRQEFRLRGEAMQAFLELYQLTLEDPTLEVQNTGGLELAVSILDFHRGESSADLSFDTAVQFRPMLGQGRWRFWPRFTRKQRKEFYRESSIPIPSPEPSPDTLREPPPLETIPMVVDPSATETEIALLEGARDGSVERVRDAVEIHQVSPSFADTRGRTALHYAAKYGHVELLRYLLVEHSPPLIPVDLRTAKGETALWLAVRNGQVSAVRLLLERGAEVDALGGRQQDRTPLMAAIVQPKDSVRVELASVLLVHLADMHRSTRQGMTPLHFAVSYNRVEMVQLLLENGARQDLSMKLLKWTPLHLAANLGRLEIVRLLLEQYGKAPVHAKDHRGQTPLFRAAARGHVDVVRLLLDHGANVDVVDRALVTPLEAALRGRHMDAAQFLLHQVSHVPSMELGRAVRRRDWKTALLLVRQQLERKQTQWNMERKRKRKRKLKEDFRVYEPLQENESLS